MVAVNPPGAGAHGRVSVFFVWYNFCRVYQTLRMTPAMEGDSRDHIWTIQELLTVP